MTWHLPIYNALAYSAVAGLVVLAVASVALVFVSQPARRIRVIEIALAGLLVLPLLPLIPGYPRIAILPPTQPPGATGVSPVPSSPNAPRATGVPPVSASPIAPRATGVPPVPISSPALVPTPTSPRATAIPPVSPSPRATGVPPVSPAPAQPTWQLSRDFRLWIVIAYLAGTGAMIAWSLLGLVAIARLLRSTREASDAVRAVFRDVAGPASARVALVVSRRASQPCALIWRRPTIVLPQSLVDGGDARQLRFALAHEWSHVVRGDVWSWSLSSVVRWFYFYQPLLWHLRRQLRLCQDFLADAASAGNASEDYAEFLTSYSSHLKHPNLAPGLGIAGRASELHRRVVMLLDQHCPLESAAPRRWNLFVLPIAALLLAAVACVRAEPGDTPKAGAKPQPKQRAAAAMKKPGPSTPSEAVVEMEIRNDPLIYQMTTQVSQLNEKLAAARSALRDGKDNELIKSLQQRILGLEESIDDRKAQLRPRLLEIWAARAAAQAPATPPFSGRIRPGDILRVDLRGGFPTGAPPDNPTVEPDGYLALGVNYGRVPVGGMTLQKAEQAIEVSLRDFLTDPQVQLTYVGHDPDVVADAPPPDGTQLAPPASAPPNPSPTVSPYLSLVTAQAAEKQDQPNEPLQPLDTVEIQIPRTKKILYEIVDPKTGRVRTGSMPDFNGIYVIEPDGSISLSDEAGRVNVKGMDVLRAGRAIREWLAEQMHARTALPRVHVTKRGRAVFPKGKEPPADYRIRKGDSLLIGNSPMADTLNYAVDADGNLPKMDGHVVHVEGLTLAEAQQAVRKGWTRPGIPFGDKNQPEVEVPWFLTIGGWREQADPDVIDQLEATDATRTQRIERELQDLKNMVRQLQSKP